MEAIGMKSENEDLSTTILNLPVFDSPTRKRRLPKMTWEEVTFQTELQRQFYLSHFDSPERRLRDKNPVPFRMIR